MKKIILISLLLWSFMIAQAQEKKVLFVMSAASELMLKKGKAYTNTGVFLSEFYLAYKDIVALGYAVDFATPCGMIPSIDKESYHKKYWKGREHLIQEGVDFVKSNNKINAPMTLEKALNQSVNYVGLVVPGGQGLMVDLIRDSTMKALLTIFAKDKKSIGLICHAPALLTLFSKEENHFYSFKVSCVTGLEEFFIETFVIKGKPFNRKIGRQLKSLGFVYKKGRPAQNFAVRDGNLVTSQNPFSNEAFGRLYREALKEYEYSLHKNGNN